MVSLTDELSQKNEELVRHQEEIAQLLSQIVELQHRVKEVGRLNTVTDYLLYRSEVWTWVTWCGVLDLGLGLQQNPNFVTAGPALSYVMHRDEREKNVLSHSTGLHVFTFCSIFSTEQFCFMTPRSIHRVSVFKCWCCVFWMQLALEKEELRIHLQHSKDAQRQLTAEVQSHTHNRFI